MLGLVFVITAYIVSWLQLISADKNLFSLPFEVGNHLLLQAAENGTVLQGCVSNKAKISCPFSIWSFPGKMPLLSVDSEISALSEFAALVAGDGRHMAGLCPHLLGAARLPWPHHRCDFPTGNESCSLDK